MNMTEKEQYSRRRVIQDRIWVADGQIPGLAEGSYPITLGDDASPEWWLYDGVRQSPVVEYDGVPGKASNVAVVAVAPDGWRVRLHLELVGGTVEVAWFEIRPGPDADRLGSRVAKQLNLGEQFEIVRNAVSDPVIIEQHLGKAWRRPLGQRRGRAGRTDADYLDVAVRYSEAWDAEPRRPIKEMVRRSIEAGEHTTTSALTSLVYKARSRGLLPAVQRGETNGNLTDKAKQLLAETKGIS